MYDSVTPGNIPRSAQVVAGYIDGDYAWSSDDWEMFPDAEKVLITVTGSLTANVVDVENGDLTAAQAVEWIQAKQAQNMQGCTVYCSRSNLEQVWGACRGHGYYIWVADWTDSAHAVGSTVATQYSNVGNSYDLSEVYSQEWLDILFEANRPWPL
jgi:hypothetical protein